MWKCFVGQPGSHMWPAVFFSLFQLLLLRLLAACCMLHDQEVSYSVSQSVLPDTEYQARCRWRCQKRPTKILLPGNWQLVLALEIGQQRQPEIDAWLHTQVLDLEKLWEIHFHYEWPNGDAYKCDLRFAIWDFASCWPLGHPTWPTLVSFPFFYIRRSCFSLAASSSAANWSEKYWLSVGQVRGCWRYGN